MKHTKLSIRPEIPSLIINDSMTSDELFQNNTLRPVIKMQHDLLFLRIESELNSQQFQNLTPTGKKNYIQQNLFKGNALRSEVVGMISGCFDTKEYATYRQNVKSLNKRIIQIIIERVINTLGL